MAGSSAHARRSAARFRAVGTSSRRKAAKSLSAVRLSTGGRPAGSKAGPAPASAAAASGGRAGAAGGAAAGGGGAAAAAARLRRDQRDRKPSPSLIPRRPPAPGL